MGISSFYRKSMGWLEIIVSLVVLTYQVKCFYTWQKMEKNRVNAEFCRTSQLLYTTVLETVPPAFLVGSKFPPKRYQVRFPDSFAHFLSGKQLMETTGMTTVWMAQFFAGWRLSDGGVDGNCDEISLSQGKSAQSQPKNLQKQSFIWGIFLKNHEKAWKLWVRCNMSWTYASCCWQWKWFHSQNWRLSEMLHVGKLQIFVRFPSLGSRENKPWIEPSNYYD